MEPLKELNLAPTLSPSSLRTVANLLLMPLDTSRQLHALPHSSLALLIVLVRSSTANALQRRVARLQEP